VAFLHDTGIDAGYVIDTTQKFSPSSGALPRF
jgi:hypothetical protein